MNLYENGIKLWHRLMKLNIKSFWKRIRSHRFLSKHPVVGYRTMQAAYHSSCRFRILRLCLACGSSFRWNQEERSVYVRASDCPNKMDSGYLSGASNFNVIGFWNTEGVLLIVSYHLTDTRAPTVCLWFKFIIPFHNEYEFVNKEAIHLSYLVPFH
jgi:hypothetical protein